MPNVALYNIAGEEIGKVKLSEEIFGHEVNEAVLHTVVTAYLANQRQETQSALTRAEVSGGGIKPWRQKGTGRARQGSIRAPQWIKGGVVFAPKPRDFSKKVNKKMKAQAFRSALSTKLADNELIVLDQLVLAEAKTKAMASILKNLNCNQKTLLVVAGEAEDANVVNVLRASGNIANLTVVNASLANVYQLVANVNVVATKDAIKQIEEAYAQ